MGGVAASILGSSRATRDVDALVWLDEAGWEKFLAAGTQFGFVPRVPNSLGFARKNRVLLLRHEPAGVDVDVLFGALPFEKEAIERGRRVIAGGVSLPLPTPEDLIIMKAIAPRPRDLVDVEALLDTHPRLDLRRIRRWVRGFSEALDQPAVLADLEALIVRRRKRKR